MFTHIMIRSSDLERADTARAALGYIKNLHCNGDQLVFCVGELRQYR